MLKETILKYDGFVDNVFLDQYLQIINSPANITTKLNIHHSIPVCWYAINFSKVKLDNRKLASADINQELVKLSYEQHLYVHSLLVKCTVGELNTRLTFAYMSMCKTEPMPKVTNQKHKIKTAKTKKAADKPEKKKIKKLRKKYPCRAMRPSVIKAKRKKAINKLAKQLYHASNRTQPWESCKQQASIMYDQSVNI